MRFVAKLSPAGGHLWSRTWAEVADDYGYGIAVDGGGQRLVTGYTNSSGWVTGGFDTSYNGGYDAFVAKIGDRSSGRWPICRSTTIRTATIRQPAATFSDNAAIAVDKTALAAWTDGYVRQLHQLRQGHQRDHRGYRRVAGPSR